MIQRHWQVSVALVLLLAAVGAVRLVGPWQRPAMASGVAEPAAQVELCQDSAPPEHLESQEPPARSDAERRFLTNSPRHWRQLMIRR